jgi:hypothetical protein
VTPSEATHHALARLAFLLRRRYGRQSGRDFVVVSADPRRLRQNTDEMVTQPMRTFATVP